MNTRNKEWVFGLAYLASIVIVACFAMNMGAFHRTQENKSKSNAELVRVVDGDTVYVMHRPVKAVHTKLRLLNIDTPERKEKYYKEATDAMRALLHGRKLRLEYEKDGIPTTGNYGRLLVFLFADNINVNVEMVRLGWSKYYVKYGKGRLEDQFRRAEKEARENKRGLWK